MYAKPIALAAATLLVLTGCGDSHEQVYLDNVALLSEMNDILEGVTDKSSAEAAKPKIEALTERRNAIVKRANNIGKPSDEVLKQLQDKHKDEIEKQMGRLMGNGFRLMANQEVQEVLGSAMMDEGVKAPEWLDFEMGGDGPPPGMDIEFDVEGQDFQSMPEGLEIETPDGGPAFTPDNEGAEVNPFESDSDNATPGNPEGN